MSCQEQQKEEVEVLMSIYEGDSNFKQLNDTTYQYKYGEEGSYQSFLLELKWGENYPDEAPTINLDLFYNKHVVEPVKEAIQAGLGEQLPDFLGMPMTFSLFEWVKDNLDTLLETQPDAPTPQANSEPQLSSGGREEKAGTKKEKKEQLSKQQKRRMFDKFGGNADDRPRGWDWVDVIKHLSQTGGKASDTG